MTSCLQPTLFNGYTTPRDQWHINPKRFSAKRGPFFFPLGKGLTVLDPAINDIPFVVEAAMVGATLAPIIYQRTFSLAKFWYEWSNFDSCPTGMLSPEEHSAVSPFVARIIQWSLGNCSGKFPPFLFMVCLHCATSPFLCTSLWRTRKLSMLLWMYLFHTVLLRAIPGSSGFFPPLFSQGFQKSWYCYFHLAPAIFPCLCGHCYFKWTTEGAFPIHYT